MDEAENLNDLSGPGFGTHPLHTNPQRYAMAVNGPWRITFRFENGNALQVDWNSTTDIARSLRNEAGVCC
jgi:toxin HigB-1